jgi:hypothetical protein
MQAKYPLLCILTQCRNALNSRLLHGETSAFSLLGITWDFAAFERGGYGSLSVIAPPQLVPQKAVIPVPLAGNKLVSKI